jgi:hypothetical protein
LAARAQKASFAGPFAAPFPPEADGSFFNPGRESPGELLEGKRRQNKVAKSVANIETGGHNDRRYPENFFQLGLGTTPFANAARMRSI